VQIPIGGGETNWNKNADIKTSARYDAISLSLFRFHMKKAAQANCDTMCWTTIGCPCIAVCQDFQLVQNCYEASSKSMADVQTSCIHYIGTLDLIANWTSWYTTLWYIYVLVSSKGIKRLETASATRNCLKNNELASNPCTAIFFTFCSWFCANWPLVPCGLKHSMCKLNELFYYYARNQLRTTNP